jgi:hypothetical protein
MTIWFVLETGGVRINLNIVHHSTVKTEENAKTQELVRGTVGDVSIGQFASGAACEILGPPDAHGNALRRGHYV